MTYCIISTYNGFTEDMGVLGPCGGSTGVRGGEHNGLPVPAPTDCLCWSFFPSQSAEQSICVVNINVKPEASVTLRTTAVMDADTQGLASGLALFGIYNVAYLVEMARCGVLHEVWS